MGDFLFKRVEGLPPVAIHDQSTLLNKTGTWRSVRPVYVSKLAPCRQNCPAGVNIPAYFNLVRHGRLAEAWELIRQDNPLPAVCGRVCYHPCEEHCNRGQFDETVSINAVERVVGDHGLNLADREPAVTAMGPRVAVVGSGPAGLSCAYHLARLGNGAAIYEATSSVGGMLALGIPEYRLPRDVLRAEIASIERMGVKIVTGVRVGSELPLRSLFEQGFRAVFLAIGAHRAIAPQLLGLDKAGVLDAIGFLRQVNANQKVPLGRRVAVIGGGNVAIDAARCARRLGSDQVTILYRRSRDEMPAHAAEIESAEVEGVRLQFLVVPTEVLGEGRVMGLKCQRTTLGDPDASGRRTPRPVPDSEFTVEVDTVIVATGQTPDVAPFVREELALNANGTIRVDESTLATSRPGVFAGGDATTGPARVVDAIAAGKRAAHSIHRYLVGQLAQAESDGRPTVGFGDLNLDYFQPVPRVKGQELPPDDRLRGFSEVSLPLSADEAQRESERCFSCGLCNGCDNCWLYCPDLAVSRQGSVYSINYDYCKGCGVCVVECPRSAIRVEEEAR